MHIKKYFYIDVYYNMQSGKTRSGRPFRDPDYDEIKSNIVEHVKDVWKLTKETYPRWGMSAQWNIAHAGRDTGSESWEDSTEHLRAYLEQLEWRARRDKDIDFLVRTTNWYLKQVDDWWGKWTDAQKGEWFYLKMKEDEIFQDARWRGIARGVGMSGKKRKRKGKTRKIKKTKRQNKKKRKSRRKKTRR
jgi:hypothetical protein